MKLQKPQGIHKISCSRLYVILDSGRGKRSLVEALTQAAAGGAQVFQYRAKSETGIDAFREASRLRRVAAEVGALFVVNNRCDLALAVDADGVHLGQDDLPLAHARGLMGADRIIGISTHNPAQVKEALHEGADYLGFGPIFSTGSKQDHDPVVGLEGLREVRSLTSLPIFAIGGIGLETASAVKAAGASGVAVISAILDAPDITETVRQFLTRLS
jgi:thiamine-phosphate pyrophosphorylase